MKNTAVESYFLALLRAGLWGGAELPAASPDWSAILTLAQRQTVLGVICDGIGALAPPAPSPEILLKLAGKVISVERQNKLFANVLARLVAVLRDAGIKCVLLKGQGLAQYYPTPSRRQCGDIDLWVSPADYAAALQLLAPLSSVQGEEDDKHKYFIIDNIDVEVHRSPVTLSGLRRNARLGRWTLEQLSAHTRQWMCNGVPVAIPGVEFDSVFVFAHFYTHFLEEGTGLRQLCDWMMFLNANAQGIDRAKLHRNLERFSLLRPWKIFACIAVDHLGLSKQRAIFYESKYRRLADRALQDILQGGNFGHYRHGLVVPEAGQIANVRRNTARALRILTIFPVDTARSLAEYYRLRFGRLIKGKYFGYSR